MTSPLYGKEIVAVVTETEADYESAIQTARQTFLRWRQVPSPKREERVYQIGLRLRSFKAPLGALVSYENDKSLQEGQGAFQEMTGICYFAVGQSRQLYGSTMHSERPQHRM